MKLAGTFALAAVYIIVVSSISPAISKEKDKHPQTYEMKTLELCQKLRPPPEIYASSPSEQQLQTMNMQLYMTTQFLCSMQAELSAIRDDLDEEVTIRAMQPR